MRLSHFVVSKTDAIQIEINSGLQFPPKKLLEQAYMPPEVSSFPAKFHSHRSIFFWSRWWRCLPANEMKTALLSSSQGLQACCNLAR
jgi:hypothetical protein